MFFFLLLPPPPRSTLFPYTTLFRSACCTASSPCARSSEVSRRRGAFASKRSRAARKGPGASVPISAAHSPMRSRESRSEEHTSELQSPCNLVCRLLLEKKKKNKYKH